MFSKDKTVSKNSTSKATQTNHATSYVPTTSRTMVVSDTIEYNVVEDMKKTKANISIHELTKLKQRQNILLRDLNVVPASALPAPVVFQVDNHMGKPPSPSTKIDPTDIIMIGDRSISHTPPFLLTYEIFNKNVHNCLIDSGASSNIIPKSVCSS